jgi:phosphoribosylformylglycinamidine synthase
MASSPNICHKHWVFDQYDSSVRTNTVLGPGSDAAVMRLRKTNKALAMTTDCNARYCYINPRLGGQSAVAESARNIVCSGGKPLAITNCLNFGNPYKPEIYYGFKEAVGGMGDACRVFETPVTGGNVSFYNEDPDRVVFPTPTIGMIGMIDNIDHITTQWFKDNGDVIFLLGTNKEELGVSEYLHAIFNQTKGSVPELDLQFEKKMQTSLLDAIKQGNIKSAHDTSEGGLAIALSECCISNSENKIGADVQLDDDIRTDALLFGETQSRVLISCSPDKADEIQKHFDGDKIACTKIGTVGGKNLKINNLINIDLEQLWDAWYNSMSRSMERVS